MVRSPMSTNLSFLSYPVQFKNKHFLIFFYKLFLHIRKANEIYYKIDTKKEFLNKGLPEMITCGKVERKEKVGK